MVSKTTVRDAEVGTAACGSQLTVASKAATLLETVGKLAAVQDVTITLLRVRWDDAEIGIGPPARDGVEALCEELGDVCSRLENEIAKAQAIREVVQLLGINDLPTYQEEVDHAQ